MYNTKCELRLMMCSCGLISCNTRTPLVWAIDKWGDYACVGRGGLWEISSLSFIFSLNLELH